MSGTFYATATAVLVALLITWLVSEARLRRDATVAARTAPGERSLVSARLLDAWIVGIALLLSSAAIVALLVQYRESEPQLWQRAFIWAALGLGFGAVAFSLATMVVEASDLPIGDAALQILRRGGQLVPIVAGLVLGYLAAPERIVAQGARFAVYGTDSPCRGDCGLKQRTGPGPSFPAKGRLLQDGERVLVVCQVEGVQPRGATSHIWDKLDNGLFVSDAWVLTPARNRFSSILTTCPRGGAGSSG
jgi:hypothetical protein